MKWLIENGVNLYLLVAVGSWLIAQVVKTLIYAIINKKLDFERLIGDGGMPSAHSATVTSLATFTGFMCGWDSPVFAIAAVFALVVCHDAMGVRREAGKHALLLIEISKAFEELIKEELPEVKLKEFVGHTPVQVCAGMLLGLLTGSGMYCIILGLTQ